MYLKYFISKQSMKKGEWRDASDVYKYTIAVLPSEA